MKECTDEAMPRRSGTWSSSSSVTTGTISDQPNEYPATGSIAQAACGGSVALSTTLISEAATMIVKP